MKQVFFLLVVLIAFPVSLLAQQTDTTIVDKDSSRSLIDTSAISSDSAKRTVDSIEAYLPVRKDTSIAAFIRENSLLNSTGTPAELTVKPRKEQSMDSMFYLLTAVVLMLAFFRYIFGRYFSNLFRVFFNTSLRQSQLTDQLLQAKLPSLFFNLFFVISAGLYSYFLMLHYHWLHDQNVWIMIGLCISALGLIYFLKFCTLKFTGWVTGYGDETDTYIFVLFLINKIMGIFLVPFTILMAFSGNDIVMAAVPISLIVIGFLLLLRLFRSYGLLQNQLKVSRFHLLLYIIGVEILPLLLIYKGLVFLLNKNL